MISTFATESLKEEVDSLDGSSSEWSWISEPVGISRPDAFTKSGLLEQINTTADRSDYLWYSLRYKSFQGWDSFFWLEFLHAHVNFFNLFWSIVDEDNAGDQPVLHIESLGHALHAFVNGKLAGKEKKS